MPQEIKPGAVRMGVGGVRGGGGDGGGDGGGGGRRRGGGGGGRRRRRGGGGGGGRQTGGTGLDALLNRATGMIDFGMEQARAEAPRQAKAFDYFTQRQESELEDAEARRDMARQEALYARQRELAGGKERRTAATSARERERATLNDALRGRGPASLAF